MKKMFSCVSMSALAVVFAVIAVVQPACSGAFHEPEMPQDMFK